ncbi:kievitone hydratase [Colletotrichum camelliae]|nr:kievitone hydratase [Colletotrichum camelliae]
MQSSLLKLAILLAQPLAGTAATFRPERDGLLHEGLHNLPTFSPAVSQTINQTRDLPSDGSFWSSSFIHASNNHSYLVLSHLLSSIAVYRASVLDITDPSHPYAQYQVITSPASPFSPSGVFNASFPDYGFGSTSTTTDGISELRTWSARPDDGVEFDLTFSTSAPILLNGGLGFFQSRNSTVYEWSMPAGLTRGWIAVNGTRVAVDPARSLTWYDRQWGGAPPGWSWFELHLDQEGSSYDVPMSVWVWEEAGAAAGLATIRDWRDVQKVVPVTSLVPSNRTYTSPSSGAVYPLDWTLELGDATRLSISSVRPDQEMVAEGGLLPTYEGYVTVSGVYQGNQSVEGYGLVELEIVTSDAL